MSQLDELLPYYPEILELMPDEFDSHQFILQLAQKHQPEYVRLLCAYQDAQDGAPFRAVHQQISKSLDTYADRIGDRTSPDIFGANQSNAFWRKK